MRALFKTVYHKKKLTLLTLSVLFVFTLVSIQIQVTTSSKQMTLVDRVEAVNGAHTLVFLRNPMYFDLAINTAQRYGKVEETDAFPYMMDVMRYGYGGEELRVPDIIFEGYVSDGTNLYRVLEGKPLDQLEDFEVAITESYARKLRKQGINPIGHIFDFNYLNDIYNWSDSELEFTQKLNFKVVTIIDYPNFNEVANDSDLLDRIPLFNRTIYSVGITSPKTFENLREITIKYMYEGQEMEYKYPRFEYTKAIKVHMDNYSVENEKQLEKELLDINGTHFNAGISAYPLHSMSQYVSTEEVLFNQVSTYLVGGLILSTAYAFYVFLRRQLVSNAKTIGTLGLLGIKQRSLILMYMSQIMVIVIVSLLLWGGMNTYLQMMYQTDRSLASLLDINQPILFRILGLLSIYILILAVVYYTQLQRYIRQAFLMTKTTDKKFLVLPSIKTSFLIPGLTIKTMMNSLSFTLGSVTNVAIIVLTLLVSISIYGHVSTIYNEETLGIKFDYIVYKASVDQYNETKQFSSAQAVVQKVSDMYFVDIKYSTNKRVYYRSNILAFYDYMYPFVPLYEGEDITPTLFEGYSENRFYYRFMHATRRHVDLRDADIYHVDKIKGIGTVERLYLFYLQSQFSANSEASAQIAGKVNSLIDNGWVAYMQTPNTVNPYTFPVIDTYFVNVEESNREAFLAYLDNHQLEYTAYQEVIDVLQANNNRVVSASLQIMIAVILLLIFILVVSQSVTFMTNQLENKGQHRILNEIGVSSVIINRKMWLQELLTFALGLILAAILYLLLFPWAKNSLLQAYGLFSTIPLPHIGYWVYGGIIALILVAIIVLSKIKRRFI